VPEGGSRRPCGAVIPGERQAGLSEGP